MVPLLLYNSKLIALNWIFFKIWSYSSWCNPKFWTQRPKARCLALVGVWPNLAAGEWWGPWPVHRLKQLRAELTGCSIAGPAQKLQASCQLHLLHGIKNLYSNNLNHSNHALHARQVFTPSFWFWRLQASCTYYVLSRVNIQWCTSTVHAVSKFLSTKKKRKFSLNTV